jgi:hypothetical protein
MAIRMSWGVARDAADATSSATNAPEASALYDRKYPRARRTAPSPPAKSSWLRESPGELPSGRRANPSYTPIWIVCSGRMKTTTRLSAGW